MCTFFVWCFFTCRILWASKDLRVLILEGPNLITAEGFRVCHFLILVKQANVELFLKVRAQAVAWEKRRY